MDDIIFTQLRELIQDRSGLFFSTDQHADFVTGIQRAMLNSDFDDPYLYHYQLEQSATDHPLWKQVVNELTIGETYFFRNRWHFKALREEILPALINKRRLDGTQTLRFWSAGGASGEEAYSLAILLQELIPDIENWKIFILATDINEQSLQKALLGHYGDWSFRDETPNDIREKYFLAYGNMFELTPEIRHMVDFRYLNLVDGVYPTASNDTINMDIILCRNVTIYFDRPTTQYIVERFHNALIEEGWLFVGHSEPLTNTIYSSYEVQNFTNTILYRKSLSKETPDRETWSVVDELPPELEPIELPTVDVLRETKQDGQLNDIYEWMANGNFDEAREALTKLIEDMPDQTDALFLLAKITADEGQLDAVHEILDTIDELNPLIPQAHYLRALLHQQSSSWNDAKSALRRALYADRKFVLAHYYMGELLYTEGNVTMAHRSWQNALTILNTLEPNKPIPFGDGLMVGTLKHAIEQRLDSL